MRDVVGDRTVLGAARYDEQVSAVQRDGLTPVELDAEAAVPAQEQLVLLVGVPRESPSKRATRTTVSLAKVRSRGCHGPSRAAIALSIETGVRFMRTILEAERSRADSQFGITGLPQAAG
ncbi:MAG TPA: hypothetical protein VE442_13065 [Jatrophihabitans sp.]|jgi:hypothetical protein|nr:hypothetical protein [Jatrophihabitans sp.]